MCRRRGVPVRRWRHAGQIPETLNNDPFADGVAYLCDAGATLAKDLETQNLKTRDICPCADGVAYLRDAGATLAAFADAFPPAAALVLAGGDGAMLGALAGLHDALPPQLLSLACKAALPEPGAQVPAPYLLQKWPPGLPGAQLPGAQFTAKEAWTVSCQASQGSCSAK